jgi:hypothetical protein
MMRMIALALVACSLRADPQDLLGKRLQHFAGKCKIKQSTDRSRGPMVCRVKGQPRYFGKIKISEEYLYFDGDRVVQVKVVPDINMSGGCRNLVSISNQCIMITCSHDNA